MVSFSNDTDLLRWEPALFLNTGQSCQCLSEGEDGILEGTSFSSEGAQFVNQKIKEGHVLTVSNAERDWCYEIVSVNSENNLTISLARTDDTAELIGGQSGENLTYRIVSYQSQAAEVGRALVEYFRIDDSDAIVKDKGLRSASVFAILSSLYASQANGDNDIDGYWRKSARYQQLYLIARDHVQIFIDHNNDGIADQEKRGGSIRLTRN